MCLVFCLSWSRWINPVDVFFLVDSVVVWRYFLALVLLTTQTILAEGTVKDSGKANIHCLAQRWQISQLKILFYDFCVYLIGNKVCMNKLVWSMKVQFTVYLWFVFTLKGGNMYETFITTKKIIVEINVGVLWCISYFKVYFSYLKFSALLKC